MIVIEIIIIEETAKKIKKEKKRCERDAHFNNNDNVRTMYKLSTWCATFLKYIFIYMCICILLFIHHTVL